MDEDHVARRLKELRESEGMTQLEFGAATGNRPETINRWENGKTHPSLSEMIAIARKFHRSLDWFAGVDAAPQTRIAEVTERAESTIKTMQAALSQLLADLAAARSLVGDEVKIERALGKQAAKKKGNPVAVPREAAG
jgi:transcriptional regulator with XRE-family HTH domain